MSIDLNLLVDRFIDIDEIEQIIFNLQFEKSENYENSYVWFDTDYISTRGCQLYIDFDIEVIISVEPEVEKVYKTVLKTRTNAGRSFGDIEMQILVLKQLQEKFGGEIFDPDEIKYGFFENDWPNLSRTEIACGLAYLHFQRNLNIAKSLIEEVNMEANAKFLDMGFPIIDKPLLRNNTLLPFFVSVLETFLKLFFMRYLETNDEAVNKIFKKKDKLSYSIVQELLSGKKTIIEIEVEEYSFQNFNSANKGYKNYLNFDLYDVLRKKVSYNGNDLIIASVLQEMINLRHEIIHEAIVQPNLDKVTIDKYYYFLEEFGVIFINDFMEKNGLRLLIEEEL